MRDEISERYDDFKDSNSLTVMDGMDRGVGCGGRSKSSRFIRLRFPAPGVAGYDLPGEGRRWLLMYDKRLEPVFVLIGDGPPRFCGDCCVFFGNVSNCCVKSRSRLVVSPSCDFDVTRRGVGEGEREEERWRFLDEA